MKLYQSNAYSSPLTYPVVMTLKDRVHMKIKLFSSSSLKMYPQNCFASPSQNRNDRLREYLVENRFVASIKHYLHVILCTIERARLGRVVRQIDRRVCIVATGVFFKIAEIHCKAGNFSKYRKNQEICSKSLIFFA